LTPVVALLVAFFIIKESYNLLKRAFSPLLDAAWQEDEVVEWKINSSRWKFNYHSLRTRIAGNYRLIDIHLEISKDDTVGHAHQYCDEIEK